MGVGAHVCNREMKGFCLCNIDVRMHISCISVHVCLCMHTCILCTPVHMHTFESGSLERRSLSHVLGTCGLCGREVIGLDKLTSIPSPR